MEATANNSGAAQNGATPPYGPFRTFWNFIGHLHDHYQPLPQLLDRSVMASRGGTARSELYTALRFFQLINEDKSPTDALKELTADPTADKLRTLVEQHYAPVIEVGLGTATPKQVDDVLSAMGSAPGTVSKARIFFIGAANEVGIELGRALKTSRGPAAGAPRRRRTTKARGGANNGGGDETPLPKIPPVVGALIQKLPPEDAGWSEAEASQWLSLVAPAIAYDYNLDLSKLTGGGSSP